MHEAPELSAAERDILMMALEAPLVDRDPVTLGLCLRLCGRRLLQRAGTAAVMNGWRGSPHAFVLSREGWRLVKAQRHGPMRRAG